MSKTVPISARALLGRINRKLRAEGLLIKRTREQDHVRDELGEYFAVDLGRGIVTTKKIDFEAYCRKHGVLKDWEHLE